MFDSHLGMQSMLGGLGADETSSTDWRTSAVQQGGSLLKNLTGQAIDQVTGTSSTPAPASTAAQLPAAQPTNVPVSDGAKPLPVGIPPAPPKKGLNMLWIGAGVAAVGIVGFLVLRKKPKKTRRRRRR